MKNLTVRWYSIISGTVLLVLLLVILILIPCPSNAQYNFFRIFISLAAAAFAATIPGSIKVHNKFVVATSSVGVFVLVYLINPAGWNTSDNCNLKNLKAIVYINGQLKKDIEVIVPTLGKSDFTDAFGSFNIEYAAQQIKLPLSVIFKDKSGLDTTIILEKLTGEKMEFHLIYRPKKSTLFSITGNSMSYSYEDLNLNISLINSNKIDPANEFPYKDTLSYHLTDKEDTVYILPSSHILNQVRNKEVVRDFDMETIWINQPQLDFKFTNNTDNAVFLNEIVLAVDKSISDNNAFIVPIGTSEIGFGNFGWGDAKDIRVDFNLAPFKTYAGWKGPPYDKHYEFKKLTSSPKESESAYSSISIDLKKILKETGIPEEAFEYGEYADDNPQYKELFKKAVGDYDKGGIAYGNLYYSDADGISKQQKFEIWFEISGGYGGGEIDVATQYNTLLNPEGQNYLLSIPVSQGIKPKDFDRFSLTFAAPQSSKHFFRLSFLYNDKKIDLPYIFCIDYFNTRSTRSMTKEKVSKRVNKL